MDLIFINILSSLKLLFLSIIILYIWRTADKYAMNGRYKEVLWKGFLYCAGIALLGAISVGEPSCIDSEIDLHGSVCVEYADDGFVPTTEDQVGAFAYYMTLFYLPVFVAAINHRKDCA
jgi:hypothetical protein